MNFDSACFSLNLYLFVILVGFIKENNMFCEICTKEIENYNSKRFCSKHCKAVYVGRQTKFHICNWNKNKKALYNRWECNECSLVFDTRAKLYDHKHVNHPFIRAAWNTGLNKKTNKSVAKYANTYFYNLKTGITKPGFLGKHHSEQTKIKLRKCGRLSKRFWNM